MSKMIEAQELRRGDMFELANGSAYQTAGEGETEGMHQARLWCAHAPDSVTFEPQLIDLPPAQEVRLITGRETESHIHHDGFVEQVFRSEMDRRNQAMMHRVYQRQELDLQEQRASERAQRPWWKKMLG